MDSGHYTGLSIQKKRIILPSQNLLVKLRTDGEVVNEVIPVVV